MSKRIWQHPEVPADETTVAWRSEGQLQDSSTFRNWLEQEFPRGAAELANEGELETSRRSFMKLMGASTALAGLGMASCRRPESYIVPYTKAPEWVIPGKATYYASAMPSAKGAVPLVVTTFEGRPTKLAPNQLHPDAAGTDAYAQASVLNLYSPSRSRQILKQGQAAKRADLEAVIAGIAKDKGSKIGFVFGADDSPTRARLIKQLGDKFKNGETSSAKFYQYEALSPKGVAGDGVKLVADFAKADRILALDCDFASTDPQGPVTAFFDRRKPEGKGYNQKASSKAMNRLYAVEAAYSMTGGMADHRLRVAPSQVEVIAQAVAAGLGVSGVAPVQLGEHETLWVTAMVDDLKASGSQSLVLAGSRQTAAVQQLALAINQKLDSIGAGKPLQALQSDAVGLGDLDQLKADIQGGAIETLVLLTPANPVYDAPSDLGFADLLTKVKTSIHLGERTDATAHAATWHIPAAHYLESWSDARSARGTYTVVQPMILPLYDDCVSEFELLLALLADDGKLLNGEGDKGAASPAYDAVRKTFEEVGAAGEAAWKQLLRDGFFAGSSYAAASLSTIEPQLSSPKAPTKDSLEVIFATDASVYDGRWIDNAWLQEVPDPVSKLTWDNAALIAPKTAKALGIYDQILEIEPRTKALNGLLPIEGKFAAVGPDGEGQNRKSPVIEIQVNGQTLLIPVLISFGQAENTIVIPLGYGQGINEEDDFQRKPQNQKHVGLVGVNRGFNAYPLRQSGSLYFATGGKVAKTDRRYPVALTQEHSAMYGRALAREISTMTDSKKGSFEAQLAKVAKQGIDSHAPPNISLYKPMGSETWNPGEDGKAQPLINDPLHQWGMSIDLSACMGCAACSVACQAENNIPVVGKEQVAMGREMHWIRMDRYYAAQEHYYDKDGKQKETPEWVRDNPVFVPQPVACVQCESAPCETVCPVNATVHTEDGLNAMAYNRCIGTRYCANNCPYKARRFNFFDYNKRNPLIKHNLYRGPLGETDQGGADHLQKNPNVTVRMRGVMEKCTYCVQRLKDAVIRQKRGQKQEALVAGKASTEMGKVESKTLRIPADSVKVACQEACPADAITFGNLLSADSRLRKVRNEDNTPLLERNYDLLNYIGTRPRTSYLARVKNPNEKMPDAEFIGKATIHMA